MANFGVYSSTHDDIRVMLYNLNEKIKVLETMGTIPKESSGSQQPLPQTEPEVTRLQFDTMSRVLNEKILQLERTCHQHSTDISQLRENFNTKYEVINGYDPGPSDD